MFWRLGLEPAWLSGKWKAPHFGVFNGVVASYTADLMSWYKVRAGRMPVASDVQGMRIHILVLSLIDSFVREF